MRTEDEGSADGANHGGETGFNRRSPLPLPARFAAPFGTSPAWGFPFPPAAFRFPFFLLLAVLGFVADTGAEATNERPALIVAVGAAGEDEFGTGFAEWAHNLESAARRGGADCTLIGERPDDPVSAREKLQLALANAAKESTAELWLVLVGHGTFDGKEAKFNLRGIDISATELLGWLQPFQRPIAIVDTTAASAPFLSKLSATNHVIVTATRTGGEMNFARFGKYFSTAVGDLAADLDKDGQTSLLEAFLMASRQVKEFYEGEGRLMTEHALLDDNGDGLGTPPDWFRGIRANKTAKDGAAVDGLRAHQFYLVRSEAEQRLSPATRARRDAIELSLAQLRDAKRSLAEDDYYQQLEAFLLELARLYEQSK